VSEGSEIDRMQINPVFWVAEKNHLFHLDLPEGIVFDDDDLNTQFVLHSRNKIGHSASRTRRHPQNPCTDGSEMQLRKKEDALKRATRYSSGSVVYDTRRKIWHLYFYENGKHRSKLIGSKQQFPSKSAAWRAAEAFFTLPSAPVAGPTVRKVLKGYMKEQMPGRHSTWLGYRSWLRNHILPPGGADAIS
jgi:hypothetical protein